MFCYHFLMHSFLPATLVLVWMVDQSFLELVGIEEVFDLDG